MNPNERDLLATALSRDIAAAEETVGRLRAQLGAEEAKILKLRELHNYVTVGLNSHSLECDGAPADGVPPSNEEPERDQLQRLHALTNDELALSIAAILQASGPSHPMRAVTITKHLFPLYDSAVHGRGLENRVFSVMKRRPDTFGRKGRGRWTLTAFGGTTTDEDDDDDEPAVRMEMFPEGLPRSGAVSP